MTHPSLLEPGAVYPFSIDLGHTAVTLNPGERLRLEIASAAFPEFSRNLNTGGDNEAETAWVVARQRVYRTAARPSHLVLPVVAPGR
jgi:predicted acyl esterase